MLGVAACASGNEYPTQTFYTVCAECREGKPAHVQLGARNRELQAIVREMKAWIVDTTQVPLTYDSARPSTIWFVPHSVMQTPREFSQGFTVDGQHITGGNVQVTLLPTTWDFTLMGMSILLHELVHELQYANGLHMQWCVPELEMMAYRLQRQWLAEQGVEIKYVLPTTSDLYNMYECSKHTTSTQ